MHEQLKRTFLNVGGNNKAVALPDWCAGFEHVLLDIDSAGQPDIVMDARELDQLEPGQFDAIYCSHNLEHYYRHDVSKVLTGFLSVLKEGGWAHIRVPDIQAVMKVVIEKNMDIEDVLYVSSSGPIMVLDVLYGFSKQIEQSGQDFYAHKTGFTRKSLIKILRQIGFSEVYVACNHYEIKAMAFKGKPEAWAMDLLGLAK